MDQRELQNAISKDGFQQTEEGLYVPSVGAMIGGRFVYHKRGEEPEYSDNLLVTEGRDYMQNVAFAGGAQIGTWYIAIFSGAVTPLASWDASNFAASATEITTQYDEASRPEWTPTAVDDGVISSYTAKSSFTANDSITVRGAALISSSAKGATTGTLAAASRFGADKSLVDGEIIDVGYQITLTAA